MTKLFNLCICTTCWGSVFLKWINILQDTFLFLFVGRGRRGGGSYSKFTVVLTFWEASRDSLHVVYTLHEQDACDLEVQGERHGRQAGHLQGVLEKQNSPWWPQSSGCGEHPCCLDSFQDPGEVPDNVNQVIASKDGLSAACRTGLITVQPVLWPGGRYSHSQAWSVPQVSGMEMMVSRTHVLCSGTPWSSWDCPRGSWF